MSKKFNREQEKFWHAEQMRRDREALHRANVRADMERLRQCRDYFQHSCKVTVLDDALIKAIDDHVEKLTGNRTSLHSKTSASPDEWWERP